MTPVLLVVDDDKTFLDATCFALKTKGEVLRASTLEDCEAQLLAKKVDVVITDYRMSLGDGHQVVHLTRKLTPPPPVILVTAYANKEMAIRSANLHVFALLEKPVDYHDLSKTVDRALAHSATPHSKSNVRSSDLIQCDEFQLNPSDFSVKVAGHQLILTETEFRILALLISRKGSRLSREEIIVHVWGKSRCSYNLLDTHLGNLRKKLPLLKTCLRSIRGKGYILLPRNEA